jgi:prepilin-type N-terminal cleavage/methylation domain-containing protein
MRTQKDMESGFTLIELLIVVVIMGTLAATGVAAYSRHITSSRAAESLQMLEAIISYCKSYHRAHARWPSENCHTHNNETNEWIDEVVGDGNVYFDYHYDQNRLEVRAHGKRDGELFDRDDRLFYYLDTQQWSATDRLEDIMP